MATSANTTALLRFLCEDLHPSAVPEAVWLRAEDLFLDWLGSALGSRSTHPIPAFAALARQMGPSSDGPAQVLADGSTSSAYWAAWANAASSHVLEQDDLHNSSVMHPATWVKTIHALPPPFPFFLHPQTPLHTIYPKSSQT